MQLHFIVSIKKYDWVIYKKLNGHPALFARKKFQICLT